MSFFCTSKIHETTITTTTEQPVHIITGGIQLCICWRLKKSHVFRYHTCRTVGKGFPSAKDKSPIGPEKMGYDEKVGLYVLMQSPPFGPI